jgi:hypothetical protein
MTDANTNVSETVSLRDIEGTLIVNEPVRSVKAPRTNQAGSIGWLKTSTTECRTAARPTNTTVGTYALAAGLSSEYVRIAVTPRRRRRHGDPCYIGSIFPDN